MPRIPLTFVSTSSDDSECSEDDLAGDFRGADWTVVRMASIESFPFSEVSHQPYGMESTFLDSVSHGSAHLRTRNSASNAQDTVMATSPSVSPQNPLPLLPHRHQLSPTSMHATHPRGANTALIGSSGTSNAAPSPTVGLGIPSAPPLGSRSRKAKPIFRRTRSLQVGAPRWRDSDGDVELLVRREVSKNGPVSPAPTEDYAVLSIGSSAGTSQTTPPPPLWGESLSHLTSRRKAKEMLTPTAAATLPTSMTLAAAASPLDRSSQAKVSPRFKKQAARTTTAATRLPAGGNTNDSRAAHHALGAAQCRSPTHTSQKELQPNVDSKSMHLASFPPTAAKEATTSPAAAVSGRAAATTSTAPAVAAAKAPLGSADEDVSGAARTSKKKKKMSHTAAGTVSSQGNGQGDASGSGDEATSRSLLTRTAKPRQTAEPSEAKPAEQRVSVGSAAVAFPPISRFTTTASEAPTLVVTDEWPPSAKVEERRRRPRRFSSRSQDTVDTISSSVETVTVKPQARHPTLKPLLNSPGATDPVLPARTTNSQSPDVVFTDTLPALSPKQLGASGTAAESSPRRCRALTMTPSVEVSPVRGDAPGGVAITRAGSMNTFCTVLPPDSPPTLRPQTQGFNETTTSANDAPSFVPPASRATAERLVTFVRAVSDPEVLHVIYDYLVEQQRSTPRFRLAATACAGLLERKEELLKAPEEVYASTPHTPAALTPFSSATHRSAAAPEFGTFTLEVGTASKVGGGTTTRAAEVRRLLAEMAAEEAASKEAAGGGEERGDDSNEKGDPDADEFDDLNYFDIPYPPQEHFSYGQPTVSGVVSRVFAEGMLFKIKTANGDYHFYNDTLQDVMMVRVQCLLRGSETINERVMLAPVEGSNETEITIAVLPEETNFFMSGVTHLPHFMAKRVPVPPDYVSPSVTQSLRGINAEINAVRKELGKWSRASDQSAFLQCCLRHHLKFTDLTFRPCAESLSRRDCDDVVIPPVTWRRPEAYVYLPEVAQTRLFRGEISCFLVRQGELGNHTVVAAMAAVAQFPSHVRWMFRHPVSTHLGKMERAVGCYRVTLLHNGWWKTYMVDDYVPASLKGPLFASCPEDPRRLWVPLLEKAYAKSLGSYAATCVMDAMEAMGDFTGFPVRYIDTVWAAAKAKPTGAPSRTLFQYLQRVVKAGSTVLLFTPSASDAASENTVTFSAKRSSRLLPVKGVTPQFLPGHIYFMRDVAHYEELDLRMAQLKNPWTWETRGRVRREKKWRYTTWYDRPDMSMSAMESALGSSGAFQGGACPSQSFVTTATTAAGGSAPKFKAMTKDEQQLNDRKGTMWVEWGEVLNAFAGGGVCYTLWRYHRYRARNAFVNGRPRFVLEMKARRKVEVFVTLSLETVSETLDSYGTVVASRPTPLCGTAMAVVQRLSKQSAKVVSESCEDVECMAGRRTYVVAKDVSMKLTIDPCTAEGTVLVVPLLDPQAAETMAHAAAGGRSASSPTQAEVRFVLSLVTEAVAGDGEELSISFVSMRRSCGVFTDGAAAFDLESTSRVTTSYQICTERGVKTLEGNRICDAEATPPPV